MYTFEVIGTFLATFGPAQDVAKDPFTLRLQYFEMASQTSCAQLVAVLVV